LPTWTRRLCVIWICSYRDAAQIKSTSACSLLTQRSQVSHPDRAAQQTLCRSADHVFFEAIKIDSFAEFLTRARFENACHRTASGLCLPYPAIAAGQSRGAGNGARTGLSAIAGRIDPPSEYRSAVDSRSRISKSRRGQTGHCASPNRHIRPRICRIESAIETCRSHAMAPARQKAIRALQGVAVLGN